MVRRIGGAHGTQWTRHAKIAFILLALFDNARTRFATPLNLFRLIYKLQLSNRVAPDGSAGRAGRKERRKLALRFVPEQHPRRVWLRAVRTAPASNEGMIYYAPASRIYEGVGANTRRFCLMCG
ncbi:hypothetical protein MRX96_000690 [Rhipicephalus microplus]